MDSTKEIVTMSDEYYYRNGTQIIGVFKTNSEDVLCIEKSVLDELLDKSKRCDALEKRDSERIQATMSGREPASRGSSDTAGYAKYFSAKSAEVRSAKKREADALIVAHSILGYDTYTIKRALEDRELHGSSAKISRAVSVSQPEDRKRLEALMADYPDIFVNVSTQLFEKWYAERLEKANRQHKTIQKVNEWGE